MAFVSFAANAPLVPIVKWKNSSLLTNPNCGLSLVIAATDLDLLLVRRKKILGAQSPADIDADTSFLYCARSVEQNSVERRLREACISPRKFA